MYFKSFLVVFLLLLGFSVALFRLFSSSGVAFGGSVVFVIINRTIFSISL